MESNLDVVAKDHFAPPSSRRRQRDDDRRGIALRSNVDLMPSSSEVEDSSTGGSYQRIDVITVFEVNVFTETFTLRLDIGDRRLYCCKQSKCAV